MAATALTLVALLVAACTPRAEAHRAERIALDHEPLDEFLDEHPYEVTEVRRSTRHGPRYVVVVELDEGVPTSAYPLDTCSIGRSPDVVTGVVWVVDVPADAVDVVSPRWGGIDCLDGA